MTDTRPFTEYKQYIERLSSWLASTNANIHEVLQSVNKQRALLIIKVSPSVLIERIRDGLVRLESRWIEQIQIVIGTCDDLESNDGGRSARWTSENDEQRNRRCQRTMAHSDRRIEYAQRKVIDPIGTFHLFVLESKEFLGNSMSSKCCATFVISDMHHVTRRLNPIETRIDWRSKTKISSITLRVGWHWPNNWSSSKNS